MINQKWTPNEILRLENSIKDTPKDAFSSRSTNKILPTISEQLLSMNNSRKIQGTLLSQKSNYFHLFRNLTSNKVNQSRASTSIGSLLPNELWETIFQKIIDQNAIWKALSSIALTSKFFFHRLTQSSILKYLLQKDSLDNLSISTKLAVKILTEYCYGSKEVQISKRNDVDFDEKDANSVATACHYKHLTIEESSDTHLIKDKNIIELLKNSPQLEKLDLNPCLNLTHQSIDLLSKHCTSLNSLTLQDVNINPSSLICISDLHSSLETLVLEGPSKTHSHESINSSEIDAGMIAIAMKCKKLNTIKLKNLPVGDGAICKIAKHDSQLRSLSLQKTKITDVGLNALADNTFKTLQKLELIEAGTFTPNALTRLVKCEQIRSFKLLDPLIPMSDSLLGILSCGWPNLKKLEIRNAALLTGTGFKQLMTQCTKLETLILDNYNVMSDSLEAILNSATHLKNLHFAFSCKSKELSTDQIADLFIKHSTMLSNLRKLETNTRTFSFSSEQEDILNSHLPNLEIYTENWD